jgi:hypothetical protein
MKAYFGRKERNSTIIRLLVLGLFFTALSEIASAQNLVNSSATISITVTISEVTAVTITPDALVWSNVAPGSSGIPTAILIENIGSTNISKVWFNASYPQNLPYGSSDFTLHDAGNFVVIKRNQTGELWYHPNLVEYNESELIYLTLPAAGTNLLTHGRFRDGQSEYFWAIKNDSAGGCTNGTLYMGVVPHNSTQQGTIDLSSCALTLMQTGVAGCRNGVLTRFNGTWGYGDVMVGRDGGANTGMNYSIMVRDNCRQVFFYKWAIDLPTATGSSNDVAFANSTIYPGGNMIANVNVNVPYGVPTGSKTGALTVFVQAVE